MKRNGSVTVTMTLVMMMVMSLLLVTLEHAYVSAGRTLAFQIFNRSLENVIGKYWAPLYTEYGIFAVPVGEQMEFEDCEAIEHAVMNTFNYVFEKEEEGNGLWDYESVSAVVKDTVTPGDEGGAPFISQVKEETKYEGLLYLSAELLEALGSGGENAGELLDEAKNMIDLDTESVNAGEEEEAEDTEVSEDESDGYEDIWNTFKTVLCEGVSGLWFDDASSLSKRKLDGDELPSTNKEDFDSFGGDIWFSEPDIDESMIDEGDYFDSLVDRDFFAGFAGAVDEAMAAASDRTSLAVYSSLNMDHYLKDEFTDGAIMYEQEYLVFGNLKDETNVKRMASSLFGIRLIASLIFLLSDPEIRGIISAWTAVFDVVPALAELLNMLITVVWAVENAVVETAALLKGKSVDFNVSKDSLSVGSGDLLHFTKGFIKNKANDYKGSSELKLSYGAYLFLFMFFVPTEKLSYRMMDVIQENMKKKYNKDFSIDRCYVGLSVRGDIVSVSRFFDTGIFGKSRDYITTAESAVYIR